MNRNNLVIPAAGAGTRLQLSIPKIFTEIADKQSVFDRIISEAGPFFDHVTIILSPDGENFFNERIQVKPDHVNFQIQERPTGMFDALNIAFEANPNILSDSNVYIQWGDQPFVDNKLYQLLSEDLNMYEASIPLIWVKDPYVQFKFDEEGLSILESREGDYCDMVGFKDMGIFSFDGNKLNNIWDKFKKVDQSGKQTDEKSFLKLIPFFDELYNIHWRIDQPSYKGLGINTPAELDESKSIIKQLSCMNSV